MSSSIPARWRSSSRTTEFDAGWTRREIADVLRRLEFAPGTQSRRAVLIDRDVRDLIVRALDR